LCYMPWPSHPPWHNQSNCTLQRVQFLNLSVIPYLSFSCYTL
jgi:hypothetical protein